MLDLYIIDQLRREEERSRSSLIPLYIEPPQPPGPDVYDDRGRDHEIEDESAGGVIIIDYFSDSEDDD